MTEGNLTSILDNGDLQSTVLLKAGNSGGPLLNRQGEMIGVNKGILELRKGVHAGVSFATSLQTVQTFLEQYRSGNGRE
jgi:serine protease Do